MTKSTLTAFCAGIALLSTAANELSARPVGRVGRPVARVARRTIILTSVYVATLPKGCVTENIDGTVVHRCGSTYYQKHGSQYVEVTVK